MFGLLRTPELIFMLMIVSLLYAVRRLVRDSREDEDLRRFLVYGLVFFVVSFVLWNIVLRHRL